MNPELRRTAENAAFQASGMTFSNPEVATAIAGVSIANSLLLIADALSENGDLARDTWAAYKEAVKAMSEQDSGHGSDAS